MSQSLKSPLHFPKIPNNFKNRFVMEGEKWHLRSDDFQRNSWHQGEDDRGLNVLWIPVVYSNYTRPSP